MRSARKLLLALVTALICLTAVNVAPLAAQDARGTVLGRVSDESGSVVPGAEVRITNENTGVAAAAKANESGNFVLPYLIPGTYSLSVEMTGFKKWIRPGIQVRINDTVEVNVDLTVGSVTESI